MSSSLIDQNSLPLICLVFWHFRRYEITPNGKKINKLDQILLNGNNVAIMVPGGDPDGDGKAEGVNGSASGSGTSAAAVSENPPPPPAVETESTSQTPPEVP